MIVEMVDAICDDDDDSNTKNACNDYWRTIWTIWIY